MQFLRTYDNNVNGTHINASEIVSVANAISHNGERITTAMMRDGTSVRVLRDADAIALSCSPMLPALPGFTLLIAHTYTDNEGDLQLDFDSTPIIGWFVDQVGLTPITIESHDDAYLTSIRYPDPDGRVLQPSDTTFTSEAAWRVETLAMFQETTTKKTRLKVVAGGPPAEPPAA